MSQRSEPDPAAALARLVRYEGRAVLATLTRQLGDLGRAEDAVQDATLLALSLWRRDGIPANPRAWLTTTLSLRTLCGFSTAEAAQALLVSEATMAKRLTRARRKVAVAHIPYKVPLDHELPDRLTTVASVVYLVFNEGYASAGGTHHLRVELAEEAIRLARLLRELLPGEASLDGLLALMMLHHARRTSRTDEVGDLVLLADQDRSEWDREAIAEGVELVGAGLRRSPGRPNPYVVQAAIAACHALAPTWAETDWSAIVSWYDVLLTVEDTAVVHLNRAAAIGERDGPAAALVILDGIDGLEGYARWHGARAEVLARLGRDADAAEAARRSLDLPSSEPARKALVDRLRPGTAS